MIASIDWDALVQVIWTSIVAGIGVTAAFGIAILGVTRAVDHRRGGQVTASVFSAVVGIVALSIVAGAIVFGIIVMTSK